jgi:uncharacterized protein YggE
METNNKKYIMIAGTVALICVAFAAVASGLKDLSVRKHPNGQVASITVTGEGEVTSVPDIATVTFTVRETGKTVPEVQKLVEAKITKAVKDLDTLGVAKKDTKTLSYTVNPHYESQSVMCTSYACPPTKTTITGYDVAETVQVKVRKVDDAGNVIALLGKANITEISGPEFTVDEPEKAQKEAKEKAIKQAQEKAQATARALGSNLGAIIQYNEDGGGYYPMMMYSKAESMMAGAARDTVSLPQGESVIKSRVTITYTID